MKRRNSVVLLAVLGASLAQAATRLTVMVVDTKTGKFVTDLKAEEFSVMNGKTEMRVESTQLNSGPIDVALLLDTSLVGEAVRPLAADLIAQLGAKEEMAVISFHSSADLIQDFTGSKDLLMRAVAGVKYGNEPKVLDALYATMNGGFEYAVNRRIALVLTAGLEGDSRMEEKDVIRLAQQSGVSIVPVYVSGEEQSMFENLARQTAGVSFHLRDLKVKQPGSIIFDAIRQNYAIMLAGDLESADKLKVTVRRPGKFFVSALPQE